MSQPTVALAGVGRWGRNLARNFHQLGALHTICDASPASLAECHRLYPGVKLTSDFDGVLQDPEVQAVAVATPAVTHYAMAAKALSAGKHVYVEKPLALDYIQGEALAQLAEQRGATLMVGHLLQYHPAVVALRELVQRGDLGQVHFLSSHRLNLGAVRTDENALWSLAPHDVSVLLALAGDLPLQVSAMGGAYLQPHIEDVTAIHLAFADGGRGHIVVSWLYPFKEQRLVVVGSRRMAVFDDVAADKKLLVYDHGVELVNGQFTTRRAEGEVVPISSAEPLNQECRHFLDCVATGQRPRTDGQEGLRVLQVLGACQHSLDTEGNWVKLSPVPGAVASD
ncbi:MAG: Gfo/Idh/MocA family oxidoreductase [Chloroflexi bacterium]|nr:Gfo/Idh/MocA family oxidoreductase [Chloroflexota bacterium]